MVYKHSRISENSFEDRMSDADYIKHLEGVIQDVDQKVENFIGEYQKMIGGKNYSLPDLMSIVNKNIPLIALQ